MCSCITGLIILLVFKSEDYAEMRSMDSSQYIDNSLYLMSTSYQIQCSIMIVKTCSILIMSIPLWLLKNHLIQYLTVP